tara:strand:- start:4212 stop:4736 length:525 start_codon:yes stop_codon:yes gene_type:complete
VYDKKMKKWWRVKVIGMGNKPDTYKVALYYNDGRAKCENAVVQTSKVKEVHDEEKRHMMEADKHIRALADLLFAFEEGPEKQRALTSMANYFKDSTNNIEAQIKEHYPQAWERIKRHRKQDAQSPRSPSPRSPSPRSPRRKTKRRQRSPRRKTKRRQRSSGRKQKKTKKNKREI